MLQLICTFKGLKFDVVNVEDAKYFKDNMLDMKLLYVVMTRALYKLKLIYSDKILQLIE